MEKNRLEAFSDGVVAIIITIMVLELKAPDKADLDALKPLLPAFLSYVLSFIYVCIYFSGCPCFHLQPHGWDKTTSNLRRLQRMASFCYWQRLRIPSCNAASSR